MAEKNTICSFQFKYRRYIISIHRATPYIITGTSCDSQNYLPLWYTFRSVMLNYIPVTGDRILSPPWNAASASDICQYISLPWSWTLDIPSCISRRTTKAALNWQKNRTLSTSNSTLGTISSLPSHAQLEMSISIMRTLKLHTIKNILLRRLCWICCCLHGCPISNSITMMQQILLVKLHTWRFFSPSLSCPIWQTSGNAFWYVASRISRNFWLSVSQALSLDGSFHPRKSLRAPHECKILLNLTLAVIAPIRHQTLTNRK